MRRSCASSFVFFLSRMTKSESRVDWRIYMLVIESDLSVCALTGDMDVKRGKRRSMWIAIHLLCQRVWCQ